MWGGGGDGNGEKYWLKFLFTEGRTTQLLELLVENFGFDHIQELATRSHQGSHTGQECSHHPTDLKLEKPVFLFPTLCGQEAIHSHNPHNQPYGWSSQKLDGAWHQCGTSTWGKERFWNAPWPPVWKVPSPFITSEKFLCQMAKHISILSPWHRWARLACLQLMKLTWWWAGLPSDQFCDVLIIQLYVLSFCTFDSNAHYRQSFEHVVSVKVLSQHSIDGPDCYSNPLL